MWLWWKNESILLIWSSARQPLGYCVLEIKLNHNGYRYGMWGALTDAYNDFILIPCCVVLVTHSQVGQWSIHFVSCHFRLHKTGSLVFFLVLCSAVRKNRQELFSVLRIVIFFKFV